ncbi:hypothetical protein F4692_000419 [Nocardioides cavernae]|uniref:Uncharacterized protein n=1 Tax=Nocardioides cavernae TaxID=1921566 RepID=A0A7Y9GZQ4_9ACTN|nr:hypothetical protein [Nocardioides cavernae]NYE35315.1 hypothetical protein [Nocardioides cavernae]
MSRTTRWLAALGAGAAVGAVTGGIASWSRTGGWEWVTVLVFGLATALPVAAIMLAWWSSDDDGGEDSIELDWMRRAHSGTFLDILVFAGSLTFLCTVLDLPLPRIDTVLWFAMLDAALRMMLLRRREA